MSNRLYIYSESVVMLQWLDLHLIAFILALSLMHYMAANICFVVYYSECNFKKSSISYRNSLNVLDSNCLNNESFEKS